MAAKFLSTSQWGFSLPAVNCVALVSSLLSCGPNTYLETPESRLVVFPFQPQSKQEPLHSKFVPPTNLLILLPNTLIRVIPSSVSPTSGSRQFGKVLLNVCFKEKPLNWHLWLRICLHAIYALYFGQSELCKR